MNLDSIIEAKEDSIVSTLQELIKIPSVEHKGEDGYPFGAGVNRCLEKCLEICAEKGFSTTNMDHMIGWCEYGQGEEMVAVLGHLDVVPEGDGWSVPPYEGLVQDGRIYGRGTMDDKGPVVASLFALEALKESGLPLSKRIRIIFGINEETGSADVKYYLSHGGEVPVMAFTPDGEYPIINGEKGIINSDYHFTLKDSGPHSLRRIQGGTAPNVVPDYAMAIINYPAEEMADVLKMDLPQVQFSEVEGGLKIEAFGTSAHGSTPHLGENAIGRLLLAMGKLELAEDLHSFISFMNEKIGMDTFGEKMGVGLEDEVSGKLSFNLGVISGDSAGVGIRINYRYPVTFTDKDCVPIVQGEFRKAGFEETYFIHKPCLYVPKDHPLIQKLAKVYEEKTGEPAKLLSIGGGTYAKAMPNTVAFGPVFPGDEIREHKPDEYMEIENLVKNSKIIAAAMYELAK